MTFIEKFEEIKSIAEKAGRVKFDGDFAVQITMTDADCGGSFYISYLSGELEIAPYDYYDRNALIIADSGTIKDILTGKLTAEKAYTDGKLIVEGSLEAAKQLNNLAKKPVKKRAVKPKATSESVEKPIEKPVKKTEKAVKKSPTKKK